MTKSDSVKTRNNTQSSIRGGTACLKWFLCLCRSSMRTCRLKPRRKTLDTFWRPVHLSQLSVHLSLSPWILLLYYLSNTKSPGGANTRAESFSIWTLTSSSSCFSVVMSLFKNLYLFSEYMFALFDGCIETSTQPSMVTWGTKMSRVVLGFPPKRNSKGDTLPGRDVSGRVRLIQHTGVTYSSQRLEHTAPIVLTENLASSCLASR